MSLTEDLNTQEALDEAIRLLYHSRPAKAAALLGLVDPTHPFSLASKDEIDGEKLSAQQMMPGRLPGTEGYGFAPATIGSAKIKNDTSGKIGDLPEASRFSVKNTSGPSPITEARPSKATSIVQGDGYKPDGVSEGREQTASLRKQAMTDQEYLMYQAGMGPIMEDTGDPSLTPTQLAALGGGTVGVAGANRLRAKNVANRELRDVRKRYLQSVQENALTRRQLKNLNAELKLRGARPRLRKAPTLGIADAYMAKAEKDLAGSVLKTRYRGALPLLAAGLIGTLAYNKLSEGNHG